MHAQGFLEISGHGVVARIVPPTEKRVAFNAVGVGLVNAAGVRGVVDVGAPIRNTSCVGWDLVYLMVWGLRAFQGASVCAGEAKLIYSEGIWRSEMCHGWQFT